MSKDVTVSGGWGRESHPLEQRSFLSLSHCRCPPWLGWAGAPPPHKPLPRRQPCREQVPQGLTGHAAPAEGRSQATLHCLAQGL